LSIKLRFIFTVHNSGEKNNSYFLGLEKKRQVKKSINKIKNENNDIATKQSEILEIIKTYYEKLYSSNKPNKHNRF
jgi:hypothetical protein